MLTIAPEAPDRPDVRRLIEEGDAYFAARFPPERNRLVGVDGLAAENATLLVARVDGAAVGTGALIRHDAGYGEIKRMFVTERGRGAGVGRAILEALEDAACDSGLGVVRLETHVEQTEALALYRSAGYGDIGPFATYPEDPTSVFLEKRFDSAS